LFNGYPFRLFQGFPLFTSVPPYSQTGEGTAVKEEEWREGTLYE